MPKSKTFLLFVSSLCFPYVQLLLMSRNHSFLLDFLAFMCVVITAIILIFRARDSSTALILYLLVAGGIILLCFAAFDTLQRAGDYLIFKSQQRQLDKFVAEIRPHHKPEGLQLFSPTQSLSGFIRYYEVLPDSTILFTRGGEESIFFWGFAYSSTGAKPTVNFAPMPYWHQLDTHWYAWFRYDN
ncbi:hypothetical protein [Hymenobacter persicinus]|uniref:Uncharacterized protein n=1 Tax=Hymenobacter persicinus TaxID=2025506 RepID=A0A4Q5LAH8_9BACT|nr:hypothetical protein [Hymenobacter persicinus]RYU78948.1 hypothetical protein EWM57_12255 [Hymenobacter persicinus]